MVNKRKTHGRDTSKEATDSHSSEEPFSSMSLKRRTIEEDTDGSSSPSLPPSSDSSHTNHVSSGKKRKAKEDSDEDPEQSLERRVQLQRRKRRKVAEEKTTNNSNDNEGTASPRSSRGQCSRSEAAKEAEEEDHHVMRLKGGGFRQFQKKYSQKAQIGQGGFGSVFDGVRKSDGLSVAIKRIAKSTMVCTLVIDEAGEERFVPLEVVLMLRAGGDQNSLGQKYGVSLIEWFELKSVVIIVMEKPEGSINLREFMVNKIKGRLTEKKAKDMIRQVICATKDMLTKSVFHRDLKCENILVQPSDSGDRVRIVDFGCGSPLDSVHDCGYYIGTFDYAPPEYYLHGLYYAKSTCVWQLGALLFELLIGDFSTRDYLRRNITFKRRVSKECRNFLTACLEVEPSNRLKIDELLSHPWF